MNVQAHVSGQISGQVPNQASNQLPGLPQQNGNTFQTQVQNLGGQSQSIPSPMDAEVLKLRRFMRDKIYETLMLRQPHPNDGFLKKIHDITKRLEERLFKGATSKEEYMNMDTLESRLQALTRRPTQPNHAPTPVGTMIHTPGMQQQNIVNSNVMVSSAMDPSNMVSGVDSSGVSQQE